MGDKTNISWTDHTFNGWWGCTMVTDACIHCYAQDLAKRTGRIPEGYIKGSRRIRSKSHRLPLLQKWDKWATAEGRKHLVFAHSMSDVFDREVDDAWRCEEFTWFAQTKNLIFQILTKRSDYPAEFLNAHPEFIPLFEEKVWLGTSLGGTKDLHMADELAKAPARLHWISYEPAITPLELADLPRHYKWLVIGGESGPKARPFDLLWARDTIAECRDYGVTPYMKQVGQNAFMSRSPFKTTDLHGTDPAEWPADLRVREFPESLVLA